MLVVHTDISHWRSTKFYATSCSQAHSSKSHEHTSWPQSDW